MNRNVAINDPGAGPLRPGIGGKGVQFMMEGNDAPRPHAGWVQSADQSVPRDVKPDM